VVKLNNQTPVFKCNKLTFILEGKDIIIKTSLNQTFFLTSNYYWKPGFTSHRLKLIRLMIQIGEIRTLDELASYTRPGLIWSTPCINYDIRQCKVKILV